FIPPAPERTVNRPRRMPGIDELPRPAQAELRAKRGEGDVDHPEKRKVSLLRRLAAVGLGRRDDQEEPERIAPNVRPARPPMPAPAPRRPRPPPAPPDAPAPPPPRAAEAGGCDPPQRGAGVGIRQAPAAPGVRSPGSAGAHAEACRGRSARHPGVLASAGQLI